MSRNRLVYVELNEKGRVSRIFKSYPKDLRVPNPTDVPHRHVILMGRTRAVAGVRHQIFVRSGGGCEYCGAPVTENTGHMHEKVFRSHGGEISLANSVFICYICHREEHGLGRGVA